MCILFHFDDSAANFSGVIVFIRNECIKFISSAIASLTSRCCSNKERPSNFDDTILATNFAPQPSETSSIS